MKLLSNYKNGNYKVLLFNNGTKIRILDAGEIEYKPKFPENMDILISTKCSIGCPWCYADCNSKGKVADLKNWRLVEFLAQIKEGTELAIGGGALSEIPSDILIEFLTRLKIWHVIANITLNAKELTNPDTMQRFESYIQQNYVYGVGISYNSDCKEHMLYMNEHYPNIVIHTINGITTPEDYQWLAKNKFKVLILGYKTFGRGLSYNENNKYSKWLEENIFNLRQSLKTLSFDCLAVEQLKLKEKLPKEQWEKYYMGDDGKFTMYLDLVNQQFAKNSVTPIEERHSFDFLENDLQKIFKYVQTH